MPPRRRSGPITFFVVLLVAIGVMSLFRYGWLMTQM